MTTTERYLTFGSRVWHTMGILFDLFMALPLGYRLVFIFVCTIIFNVVFSGPAATDNTKGGGK